LIESPGGLRLTDPCPAVENQAPVSIYPAISWPLIGEGMNVGVRIGELVGSSMRALRAGLPLQ